MPTDLDRLHKTHEKLIKEGSWERGIGKTTYHCHCVAQQLMLSPPGSTVVVVLEYYDRMQHFMPMLLDILEEYGVTDYDRPIKKYDLRFSKRRLQVKFVSVEDMYDKLKGYPHNQQLILDLEELSSIWFSQPVLVGESWEIRELQEIFLRNRRLDRAVERWDKDRYRKDMERKNKWRYNKII